MKSNEIQWNPMKTNSKPWANPQQGLSKPLTSPQQVFSNPSASPDQSLSKPSANPQQDLSKSSDPKFWLCARRIPTSWLCARRIRTSWLCAQPPKYGFGTKTYVFVKFSLVFLRTSLRMSAQAENTIFTEETANTPKQEGKRLKRDCFNKLSCDSRDPNAKHKP